MKEEIVIEPKLELKAVDKFEKLLNESVQHVNRLKSLGGSGTAYDRTMSLAHQEVQRNASKVASLVGGNKDKIAASAGYDKPKGKMAEAAGQAVTVASIALAEVGATMAVVTGAAYTLNRTMESMAYYVGKASPAAVNRLNYAWDDFDATIGHKLLPVTETWTDVVRDLGAVTMEMLPSQKEVKAVVDELKPSLKELRNTAMAVLPTFKNDFVDAMRTMGRATKWTIEWLRDFAIGVAKLRNAFNEEELKKIHASGSAAKLLATNREQTIRQSRDVLTVIDAYKKGEKTVKMTKGHEVQITQDLIKKLTEQHKDGRLNDVELAKAVAQIVEDESKNNFGAAGRLPSIVSGEDLARSAIIGAMSTGRNPEEETADNTKNTAKTTEDILKKLEENMSKEREFAGMPRRFN